MAIDVKSAENTKSKSMTNIIKNWGVEQGIKLSTRNVEYKELVHGLPLYGDIYVSGKTIFRLNS